MRKTRRRSKHPGQRQRCRCCCCTERSPSSWPAGTSQRPRRIGSRKSRPVEQSPGARRRARERAPKWKSCFRCCSGPLSRSSRGQSAPRAPRPRRRKSCRWRRSRGPCRPAGACRRRQRRCCCCLRCGVAASESRRRYRFLLQRRSGARRRSEHSRRRGRRRPRSRGRIGAGTSGRTRAGRGGEEALLLVVVEVLKTRGEKRGR